MSQGTSRFKVSMALQELICLFAQSSVFEDVSDLLEKVFPISISNKQIQRVSEWYGDQLNPIIEANQEEFIPQLPKMKQPEQTTYVMVDGSMINTIGEKWKEIKLGRLFHQDSNVEISPGRKEIQHSVYVSHLGSIDEFFPKFERHLTGYRNKVFICDGAKWIWNWVDSNYPGATQILDFYHATEKLELFARNHFIKKEKKEEWLVRQKSLLMTDQVLTVIENIQSLKPRNKEARETKEKVIQYYIEHEDRMMYQSAKNRGLLIGSGPIEAAHRKVIHQRLKLSGQKWSIKGANAIANLRCYKASNAWPLIINLIKLAA